MSNAKKVGGELQSIKQPQKVKVLILSENRTTAKDFYLINNFIKLIKIDLSYNKITSFPAGFTFNQFTHLRTLFLHYNKFSVIKNLLPITECQSIQYFTLFGNPLQQAKARHFFINQMPNLMLMDDKIVRLQQRNHDFNLGENTVSLLSFPLVTTNEQANSNIYIENLIKELTILRHNYLKINPVVRIQRWWRHLRKSKKIQWNPTFSPRQKSVERQSTIKDYKNDLDRLTTEKMEISKSGQQIIASLIYANYEFWSFMRKIVAQSKIYLSRQYCQLRAIQFVEVQNLLFIRHCNNITFPKKQKRNLLFLQGFHQQLIIKKQKASKIKAKDISIKICESYKINRKKFLINQQKLIKKQSTYHPYVIPSLSKDQIFTIVKKQYKKCILSKDNSSCAPFVIQKLAERSVAAVSIQRYWRGHKVRKSFDAYLKIKQKECAVKIQRWIRRLKFIHRHKFLLEVSHYLKKQKSNEIILQISQVEAIQTYCTYKQSLGKYLIIPFQQSEFTVIKDAEKHTQRIIFYSERKPYPSYLNLTFKSMNIIKQNKNFRKSNILQILFKEVKDIVKFVDNKGIKHIKFIYQSNEQTLNRKFILALKTYRMINHQFIRSKQNINASHLNPSSVIAQVNQQKMVSMVYDSDSNRKKGSIEELSKQLQSSKSQSSINTDMALISNTLCIKIKYYIVKNDVSCTLFVKQPNYQLVHKSVKESISLNLNHFYFGKKSKRYAQQSNNGDMYSKISRNIMSLNDFQGLLSRETQRKSTERRQTGFNKILNTDQSHTIIGSLTHENSLKKIQGYKKIQSFDKFDREVYPPLTQVVRQSLLYEKFVAHREQLLNKKQKIEQIKSNHRKNIAYMNIRKTENLQNLRRSIAKQSEENVKKIDEARSILQHQKSKKHDRIKEHFKIPSNNFESEFLKKGIRSIKRQFKEYQKHRSFRQSIQNIPNDHSHLSNSKANILKTQMKQFSINFSEADIGVKMSEVSIDFKNQPHMRQLLKRSIQNYQSRDNSQSHSQHHQTIKIQQQQPPSKLQEIQRKKMRKKRLVHSVFPEQFYPIKQSGQFGFELPKIIKK